jgi:hypothetical protein
MAGDLLATAIAAPGSPAGGQGADLRRLHERSTWRRRTPGGIVNHGIQTRTATASNWIRSIADDGTTGISQPAFTDISGSVTLAQLGSGSGLSVLGVSGSGIATRADIVATFGSGFALRENTAGVLGFGTLATVAYGANTVTYAKIQATAAGNVLIGRGTGGAGNVQELTVTGAGSFGASSLNIPKQFALTWGGGLAVGTVIGIPRTVSIGLGDNSYFDSTSPVYPNMAFAAPLASTAQDWSVNLAHSTLTGGGFFGLDFYVNGAFIVTLGTFSAGTFPQSVTVSTSQVISASDRLAIRMYQSAGSITGGSVVLYIVGSFR